MFLETCFGLLAICLPTLSVMLKIDTYSKFVESLSSLLSFHQQSEKSERPWDVGHEADSQPSVLVKARKSSDVEARMQSFEMQNLKAINVDTKIEQTRSMVWYFQWTRYINVAWHRRAPLKVLVLEKKKLCTLRFYNC